MSHKHNEVKLERSLNPMNVWSLALGCIIGWGAFVMPGTTFLPNAGVMGTVWGMAVAAVIMIIIGMNYGYMVEKYPIAGGEYTFTEKTFGKNWAYVCGWFLSLSYLCIVPLNATALGLVSRKLLGGVLQFGHLYTVAGWDIYVGEILLTSLALIIFGIFSIKGVSFTGWIQTVIAMALVASVFVLIVAAFFCPEVKLSNLQPAYPSEVKPMAAIIAVVAIAPWAFVGFDSIPQAAEEFNFSPKKVTGIMAVAIIFGAAVYVAMNTLTAAAMPWEEMMAAGYDWPTGEAVEIIMGKVGLIFLGVAMTCAVLSGIVGFYMATSRLLMSMAREHALPKWFMILDPKTKTPKNAILFVMLISLTAPWFGREVLVWVVDMSSIGAAIGYGLTSLSAFFEMRRRGDVGKLWKANALLGTFFAICFAALLVVPNPWAYLGPESRVALVVWTLLGAVFYVLSKKKK
jgi:amino acid transporter